ncbi:MAG: hypothetical protein KJ709_04775 [Nanoarchaeota archaeon]|nr:hypothetical protein [Nanoarchaeota archaeon]
MKRGVLTLIILLALLLALIFVPPFVKRSSIPDDLYACSADQDCELFENDIIKQECCGWKAVNKVHAEWYGNRSAELRCHSCRLEPPVRPRCVDNVCTIEYIKQT